MIDKILDIAFSGYWSFIGICLLISGVGTFVGRFLLLVWSRFMRMLMVRKHGWPPSHLDADGDYKRLTE